MSFKDLLREGRAHWSTLSEPMKITGTVSAGWCPVVIAITSCRHPEHSKFLGAGVLR